MGVIRVARLNTVEFTMKITVIGYWSYNHGEEVVETVREITPTHVLTEEDGIYHVESGLPDTINFTGYRIPRQTLKALLDNWPAIVD